MRLFFVRQPWMCCCVLSVMLMVALFLHTGHRAPRINVDMPGYEETWPVPPDQDAVWTFHQAQAQLREATASMDFLDHTPTLHNVERIPLGHTHPPEQLEALRRYVEGNKEALALMMHGVTLETFDSMRLLWPITDELDIYSPASVLGLPMDRIRRINDVSGIMRRAWGGTAHFSLRPLAQLAGCAALHAAIQQDTETFLSMTELLVAIVDLQMKSPTLPERLRSNLDAGFIALDMVEEGVNRMELNNEILARLQHIITDGLYNRQQDLVKAYYRHLLRSKEAFGQAREASRIPEHEYEDHSSYRYALIFDNSFVVILDIWLRGRLFYSQYTFHHLQNTVRMGRYFHYGGYDLLIGPNPAREGRPFRDYTFPYSSRRGYGLREERERPFGAFFEEARRLRDEAQLLWSLFKVYEPYGELLAHARVAECALAALQYKNDRGHLPADLNDLVPRYLEELPRDPYTNFEPVRFLSTPSRLLIYSIGPNLKDDGGRYCQAQRRSQDRRSDPNTSDIVFTLLASPHSQQTLSNSATGVDVANERKDTP